MANVIIPNYQLSGTLDPFNAIWKLTRAMKKAGWTYKSSGNGSTKDTSGTASSDLWGSNADPNLDTYNNFSGLAPWWNAQGPSTLKIPISTAQVAGSDGYFIRGENITQATTGAQGELLGYLFEPTLNTGYMVVLPRVDGSGADPHGWDHANVIAGSISGATVTPSSTIMEFVREVVFWKSSTNQTLGNIYYQCVDGYSESTSRFSVLALNANCTASVAPGGSASVGNQFPAAGTFVISGLSGAVPNSSSFWFQMNAASHSVRSLIIATSASYSSGVSADGSFTTAIGQPITNTGSFLGFMFTRVDSQEDGDVDPYVWYCPSAATTYTAVRTSDTSWFSSNFDYWNPQLMNTITQFKFWRRRGWGGTGDAFQNGAYGLLYVGNGSNITQTLHTMNYQDREKMANTYNDTYLLEDIWCLSTQAFGKTRKGICRWLKAVQGGAGCNLYGGKMWLQMANVSTNPNTAGYSFVIGPWDGVTTQTQA